MSDKKENIIEEGYSPSSQYRRQSLVTQPIKWWKLGGKDVSYVSVDHGYDVMFDSETAHAKRATRLSIVENTNNPYEAAEAEEFYKPIEGYEGTHRFDPHSTWSVGEEKKLVRKLDWKIALPACIMFFALQLDRGNITQALSDNMLSEWKTFENWLILDTDRPTEDLKLNTNDYNNGMTIFYCSFLFAELPSQAVGKKLGPDVWIPIQMLLWSAVASSQAALTGRTTFYITRFLLGLLEGGFIPDTILYLSYFFKNAELPRRLSWFWTSYQATQIVGAFLAYGILHLRGSSGLRGEGWRYLFAIEGGITASIGIFTWLYLPPSPTQTRRRGFHGLLRPKEGWFTEREETVMVTRILRDDPGKASMHNRQGLSFGLFWDALTDYDMWPIYLIGLSWQIPATPPMAYITLTCKALGFDTFHTNLLTIPAYVIFILQLLFWTWASEKMNQRLLVTLLAQFWCLPLLVALVTLPPHFHNSNWAKWALSTLLVGYIYAHAVMVGLASRNAGSVRTRTVGSSLYNMAVQAAAVFSSQIYRNDDKPYYYRGNKVLLGILAWNVCVIILAKFYYIRKNEQRNAIWDRMTREERVHYLSTTKDKGNKRLDFRFAS